MRKELLGLRADNTPMTQEEWPGPRADPNCRLQSSTPILAYAAQKFIDGWIKKKVRNGKPLQL